MLKEITLPDDYSCTLEQENDIVGAINLNFIELEKKISESTDKMMFEEHIIDFEEYEMDVYFSDNKVKATLLIDSNNIIVRIGDNEVRIDSDGNVV
jgi:hypothetical protein